MESLPAEAKICGNRTCDSCQTNSPEVFCECTGTRVYLCERCIVDHTIVKFRSLMHQLVPAEVPDVKAFRERNEAFAAGSAELRQNLSRIDQCCQEVTCAFDAVAERLAQWRDYYVQELQAWKVTLSAQIAEAENEMKAALALDEVELKGKYSKLLRHYQPGTLQLFTCQVRVCGIESWAQSVVKVEYSANMEPFAEGKALDSETKRREAAQLKEQARSKIDEGHFPEACRLCAAANEIFGLFFPDDRDTASNLGNWGLALESMGNCLEAVSKFAAADCLYSHLCPDDKDAAVNLSNWARALEAVGSRAEAVAKYAAADVTLSSLFPNDKSTAVNLGNWGVALKNMEKDGQAITRFEEAHAIYSQFFPDDISTASNLKHWGIALERLGNMEEALIKYEAADTIYSRFFPSNKHTAVNLRSWGNALKKVRRYKEAVARFAAAGVIFSRLCPDDEHAAANFKDWADVLKKMGEKAEAVRKFEAARAVYASRGKTAMARTCEERIAQLR